MKKFRWQIVIILITGLIVGILLIKQQPVTIRTVKPEPTTGGSYTEALVGSMKRLNPLLDAHNTVDQDVDRLLYSGLIRFDARGNPQADLAEKWGVSQDGTTYNFALRKNVYWHDGQPVTTADIIFTLGLLTKENSIVPDDLQAFWKDVQVNAIDDVTVQFRLPEAFAPFLDYLSIGILPEHLLRGKTIEQIADAPFNLNPVGSGPYRFDHLLVENNTIIGVVLATNEKYYGKKPYIPQLVFRYFPDSNAAFQAYLKNEVQGINEVTQDILTQVLSDPNLAIYTARMPVLAMVLFNLKNNDVAFLQDVQMRQALYAGLNRQRLIDRVLNGQAILANGPLLPDTWAYSDNLDTFPYDQQKASALLKAAGYSVPAEGDQVLVKDEKPVSLQLSYPDGETYRAIAEGIKNDWEKLGVKVTLEALPYDQLISDRLDGRNYQAALVDLNLAHNPDPDPYPFWDQGQITAPGQNYTQWDDKTVSEYLEQARISQDFSERVRLYRNFQTIFMKQLPALPLYYPVYTYAVDRQIQGISMGALFEPSDRFTTILNWYLEARRPQEPISSPTPAP